jgi:cyclopropane-fatty-acyl-phospholipid synthase
MQEAEIAVAPASKTPSKPERSPDPAFNRLIGILRRACQEYYATGKGVPFQIRWQDGEPIRFGSGESVFSVTVRDRTAVSALASLDATTIFEAYMLDHLDFRGDMERFFAFRDMTTDNHPLRYFWSLVKPLIFGQSRMDRSGIATHYDHSQEFYLSFLDDRHRCYSHGVFLRDDEPLEDAITRKLDFAIEQIGAKAGDRILDIGGGWGAFNEYAGKKGIRVTSLTISKESENFLNAMISREKIPCEVVNCHLYEYEPGMKFDGIVNLGVTEHLPDYAKSIATYQRLLKPGGKMYLDASACREKYKFHSFIYRYIYPNNCSPAVIQEWLTHLAKTPFQLCGVWDDRWNYYLTAKLWSEKFERNRDKIVGLEGEILFRQFQIYLWGTADVFKRDIMQAYRWVIKLPE